jgi:EAL and modified HD-GYP domain-containing signal transduction protein
MTYNTSDTLAPVHQMQDFYLARQPILNREQMLVGYELLFRSTTENQANITDDLSATTSVIAHAAEIGLPNVIGGLRGFINVDTTVIMSDFIHVLPSDRVVLEILETVEVTPVLLSRVAALAEEGYTFALDDVIAISPSIEKLLPFVSIVKVDVTGQPVDKLLYLSRHFRDQKKILLAEKVETLEQYKDCLMCGFDYFQGYYFAKPVILHGKKLSASKNVIMNLLTMLVRNADNRDIVRHIKTDVALSLTLLKLVNTPVYGLTRKIDSLGQALLVLGHRHLKRWLQVLLFSNIDVGSSDQLSPLLILAATRGKMLELLAERVAKGRSEIAEAAFTVGIMSLVDTLFGMDMDAVLKQINVSFEIQEALQHRRGFYGQLLKLVEYTEHPEEESARIVEALTSLKLSADDFFAIEREAFLWSNNISVNMGLLQEEDDDELADPPQILS